MSSLRLILGARQPTEESTIAVGGPGDGKRLVSVEDGSTMIPEATAGTVEPSGAKAGVVGNAPESGSTEPVASEEPTALPLPRDQSKVARQSRWPGPDPLYALSCIRSFGQVPQKL